MEQQYFKNHVAKIVLDTPEITILDWRNKNGSGEYFIRYILDKSRSTLIIQGDCGYGMFCWYNDQNSIEDIAGYSKDEGYFMSKMLCSSDQCDYTYYIEDAIEDLKDYLERNYDYDAYSMYINDYFLPKFDDVEDIEDFREICFAASSELDLEEDEIYDFGRRIASRPKIWAAGLQMATAQLKGE